MLLKWLKQARLTIWVLDLWPDTLSAIGVLKSPWLLGLVGRLVAWIYRHCDLILAQSYGFFKPIERWSRDARKTRYFPQWAEADFDAPALARATVAAELAPHEGRIKIMFAGNLGEAQDLPAVLDAAERLRGYRAAFAALSSGALTPDPALVLQGDFTEASGSAAIERLLDAGRGFSAVFAANDQMAFGAALALHRRGLQVPHDVSLVGFDDLASASFTVPPLTTVHHPVYELGQSAAQAMLQLLAGETPTLALSEPRLVVRESSVALAAQGPRGRR